MKWIVCRGRLSISVGSPSIGRLRAAFDGLVGAYDGLSGLGTYVGLEGPYVGLVGGYDGLPGASASAMAVSAVIVGITGIGGDNLARNWKLSAFNAATTAGV